MDYILVKSRAGQTRIRRSPNGIIERFRKLLVEILLAAIAVIDCRDYPIRLSSWHIKKVDADLRECVSIHRRAVLSAIGVALLAPPSRSKAAFLRGGGIAALDWALAETLIELGHPPAGVVAAADWARFVVDPELPAGVYDLGLQQEMNFELIAALQPDLILISPFLEHLEPTLERIAPTLNLSVYEAGSEPLSNRIRITHELAAHVGDPQAADRLIAEMEVLRGEASEKLLDLKRRPLLFASFVDNRHARVYGGSSLYAEVLAWLGLENGWTRPVGYFGFSTIGIEELAQVHDAEFVAIEPVPPDIAHALSSSPLWNRLPFVKAGQHGTIPAVLMFGALPSAKRLVELLVPYLQRRWG